MRCIKLQAAVLIALASVSQIGLAETASRPTGSRGDDEQTAATITFDDLKFNPGDEFRRMFVPRHIDALDGKRVRIKAYMWPTFEQTGIRQFVLLRHWGCAQTVKADEAIRVTVKEGWGAEYSVHEIVVEGRFIFDPMFHKDEYISWYRLDEAAVYTARGRLLISPITLQDEK